MTDGFDFEVYCGDEFVASAGAADRDRALAEAMHYAMPYLGVGAIEIYEVRRTLVLVAERHGSLTLSQEGTVKTS